VQNKKPNEVSNADYHADRTHLSSSALKLILSDPGKFYKRYILNEVEVEKTSEALLFGTVAHLYTLEPHLVSTSVTTYPGAVRRGKAFEEFAASHEGKIILGKSDSEKLDVLMEAYNAHPVAKSLVHEVEHTITGTLSGVYLKARCDSINVEKGYIMDIKTTRFSSDPESFKQTAIDLYYDLSAALYCEIASQVYGKPFDFYFVVMSKCDLDCRVFKSSKEFLAGGKFRLQEALDSYKLRMNSGDWELKSEEPEVQEEVYIL
jgi:hypothetical protein